MRTHILNLYRLKNLQEIDFSYKIVSFDLNYLKDNPKELNKCLDNIEYKVASNILGPAVRIKKDAQIYIAIPANRSISIEKAQAGSVNVPLQQSPDVYKTHFGEPLHNLLLQRFLDFEIRDSLKSKHSLWDLNTYQFYLKNPVFDSDASSIDIYGGFTYRLIEDNGCFYISLNPTYKYISKNYISDIVNLTNYSEMLKSLRGVRCIYQNGDNWYQIEIRGFGRKISEHEFIDIDNHSSIVKDYILNRTKNSHFNVTGLLNDDHLALLYKYPNKDVKDFHGATSLAKRIYNTEESEVRLLHSKVILSPYKRFEYINENIKHYFQNMDFNGVRLSISTEPLFEKPKFFSIPPLKFNKDNILSVKSFNNTDGSTVLKDFGHERKQWIINNQILNNTPFISQYLIVPEIIDSALAKKFQADAECYLKKLAPQFPGFSLITYKFNPGDSATFQVNEIAKEFSSKGIIRGFALFLLPFNEKSSNRKIKNFHDCLKKKFFPDIKFQCASIAQISSYFYSVKVEQNLLKYEHRNDVIDKYKSYLFYLLMEFLVVNRKWPYALNNNMNYDIYIGIDVHERYAGFSFLYKNCENIFFDYKEIPLIAGDPRKRAEKIKAEAITPILYEKLSSHIPDYAPNPNGIVLIRDGKSFGQEEISLQKVIEQLHIKGLINKDTIKWGVLDLFKKTVTPIRMVSVDDSSDKMENVISGSYKIINGNTGFIFNTGYPFKIRGTANPIHLHLKTGNIDFTDALQDVFSQTILSFSAPDKPNSLPVSIKLIDSFLAPVAANFQDISDELEEVEVINDEQYK